MIRRLFEGGPGIAAASSKKAVRPIWILALPSFGLSLGALPGAAYGALVALVHLAVSGRWDQAPGLAAGAARCAAVTAAIGLTIGIWLAISRMRQTRLRPASLSPGAGRERVYPGGTVLKSNCYFATASPDAFERERLALLTQIADPITIRRLTDLRVGRGWSCRAIASI